MRKAVSNPEPDAADKDFFQRIRRELELEISNCTYEHPAEAPGSPLPADLIRTYLNSMRFCLVEPHWEEVNIRDTLGKTSTSVGVRRMCVTMAEDEGYVLVFDLVDAEYHLAWRGENGLGTWGICGDGVGCFIAR
jgi:hypothetical protein